ncbi:hypothetical protein RCL1_003771 [Eukaryota sp. TZLM3-RCL]
MILNFSQWTVCFVIHPFRIKSKYNIILLKAFFLLQEQGICHGDVHSQNLLFKNTTDPYDFQLALIDFDFGCILNAEPRAKYQESFSGCWIACSILQLCGYFAPSLDIESLFYLLLRFENHYYFDTHVGLSD